MKIDFPEGTGKFSRILTSALFRLLDFMDIKNDTLTTYRIKHLQLNKSLLPGKLKHRRIEKEVGILIQGKIIPVTTFRICKRYKSLYPNVRIVLSTWANESSQELSRIRNLGIHVIENEVPKNPGPSNINLQIASTYSGIQYLGTFPVQYVLKNRSDCWLSSDFFLEYFQTLNSHYPESGTRIIVPSYNSFLFRLYSPSDQIQFASLELLKFFWDCPQVAESAEDFRFSESYLLRSMLERQGYSVQNSIYDSLSIYRDRFIFADNEQIGLVLNKGSKSWPGNRWAKDGYPQQWSEIQFWHWLELQSGLDKIASDYEEILIEFTK